MYVIFLALFLVVGNMAEGGHGPAPNYYKFVHVRDHQYGVTVVENPARSDPQKNLLRSSPRLNGLPDDVHNDMFCLSAGYFKGPDVTRNKTPVDIIVSSTKKYDMEERLKFFGMPVSFSSESEALQYKAVFKDVVETCKKPLGELPA